MTAQVKSAHTRVSDLSISDLNEMISVPKGILSVSDSIAKAMQVYKIYNIPYLTMLDPEEKVIGILREDTLLEYCYNLLQKTTGATSSRYELAHHDLSRFIQKTSPVLKMQDGLDKLIEYTLNTRFNLFPIADDNDKLIGTIGCRDILEGYTDGIIEITKKS